MNNIRNWYLLGILGSLTLLAIAYFYFQKHMGLPPCPLCMFQRAALVVISLICFIGLIVNPQGFKQRVFNSLIAIGAFAGIGIAGRQVWLQYFPNPKGVNCGMDPIYAWSNSIGDSNGFVGMLGSVLKGSGDCSEIDWSLLGISMGGWMLGIFLTIAVMSIYFVIKPITNNQ